MEEMREVFGKTLVELGSENDKVWVLDADLNTSTKTVYFLDKYPQRFVQVGIAEQNLVGIASGLALEGKIPFPCTFADFISRRSLDQIAISIAYPRTNVKLIGAYPGLFTGKAGATHQSVQDLANMRAMPNMVVVDPGDNNELEQVLKAAAEYVGPVYIRVTRCAPSPVVPEDYRFEWGKGVKIRDGEKVTLVGTGIATGWCLEAAEKLGAEGIPATVLHMPCLKPFDEKLLIEAAGKTRAVVTVENHSIIGGLGGAVAEVLSEKAPTKLSRVGIRDLYTESGEDDDLLEKYGMTIDHIVKAAKEVLG